jgi:2-polyprenyl-6-methoxyphenol hydroxylase-like FAD-dependent oxidoreductase
MGASVALQGAYILAKALASNDDDAAALTHYESRIIPIARSYQKSARGMRNSILSRSQIVRILRSAIVQMAPASLMAAETRRFYKADQRMADLG